MSETLGNRIRLERTLRRLTQKDLAVQAGLSVTALSEIEHDRADPKSLHLLAPANALDMTTDYLLGRTEDPTPPRKRPRPRKTAPVG
jgi:transcriptional regulator with XRE-family HTH domain